MADPSDRVIVQGKLKHNRMCFFTNSPVRAHGAAVPRTAAPAFLTRARPPPPPTRTRTTWRLHLTARWPPLRCLSIKTA
jgi:hypothetical protein